MFQIQQIVYASHFLLFYFPPTDTLTLIKLVQAMTRILDEQKVNLRIKLATIWVSTMFCFLYADYFELYVPGKLDDMSHGLLGPLGPLNQGKLIGTSVLMMVPSIMITLCILAKPTVCRMLNIIFASIYILLTIVAIQGSWYFYMLFGFVEILLLSLLIWLAVKWPVVSAD